LLFILGIMLLALGVFFVRRNESFALSPIPKVIGERDEVKIINDWFPKLDGSNLADAPLLSAKSAILVDYDTAEVLYGKEPRAKLPSASIVKVMTALVALENAKTGTVYTVSEKAAKVGEDSMGLTAGEKLKLSDLLYGLMLPSGNDAAVTISEGVAGSEDAFVSKMNREAKALGMDDTKFINASGLDEDGEDQYTTVYDLAVLAHFIWDKYPEFRKVTSTYNYTIDATSEHKSFDLYNDTNLLTTYPGVMGIKPGFTWDAGWCLMTIAKNGGKTLIGVELASGDRRGEMKGLLDYGFGKYGIDVDHPELD